MSTRRPIWPAIVVGLWIALAIANVFVYWPSLSGLLGDFWWWLGPTMVITGAMIALRRSGHVIGRLFLAGGLLHALGMMSSGLSDRWEASGSFTAAAWADVLGHVATTVLILVVPASLLLFPDGRLPSSRWRPVGWVIGMSVVLGALAPVLNGGWGGDLEQADLVSPLRDTTRPVGDWVSAAFFLLMIISVVGAAVSLIVRFRGARGVERQQMKWLALSAVYVVVAIPSAVLITGNMAATEPIEILLAGTAFASVPVAITIAILRYRLYEVDRVINRTAVYGVVVAMLVGVYAVGVFLLRDLLPGDSDLAVAASTLAVAALFNPLRRRVQRLVDRRFYRSQYQAEQVVEAFATRLRNELDLDQLRTDWVGVVKETVQPSSVSVWVRER